MTSYPAPSSPKLDQPAAQPSSLSRTLSHAVRVIATWRRHVAVRRQFRAAIDLDDRLLADIGLRRDELLRPDLRPSRSKPLSTSGQQRPMAEGYALSAALWGARFALLVFCAAAAAAADGARTSLVDHVRAANERFKNASVAVSEGYAPIPCASGVDGGAMGLHYVNKKLLADDVIDIKHPQAVMYEPMPEGGLQLIAVEYITSKGPASLENQLFNFNGASNRYGLPPFYELHVWAWKANPRGAYADMNPAVSCEHAEDHDSAK